jgi:hypothetical protein
MESELVALIILILQFGANPLLTAWPTLLHGIEAKHPAAGWQSVATALPRAMDFDDLTKLGEKAAGKRLDAMFKNLIHSEDRLVLADYEGGIRWADRERNTAVIWLFASSKKVMSLASIVVWRKGDMWFGQRLNSTLYSEPMLIGNAAREGQYLSLAGQYYDGGNSPSAGLELWKLQGNHWKQMQMMATKMECWERPDFPVVDGRKSISPVRVETRTDGQLIGMAHIGPRITYESMWTFRHGKYHQGSYRRRKTAVATLDNIAKATLHGNYNEVRRRCANSKLSKRIYDFFVDAQSNMGNPHDVLVRSPNSTVSDDCRELCLDDDERVLTFRKRNGRLMLVSWR